MKLTGTKNKCPVCGKEFTVEPPLTPNTTDKEFYGGRVKFFKDVSCRCTAQYRLCIESKFNHQKVEQELKIIDMIELKKGVPLNLLLKREGEEFKEAPEQEAKEMIHNEVLLTGNLPPLSVRKNLKQQTVLATIPNLEDKLDVLKELSQKELQTMCFKRNLQFNKHMNKDRLARILLAHDPFLVTSNHEFD